MNEDEIALGPLSSVSCVGSCLECEDYLLAEISDGGSHGRYANRRCWRAIFSFALNATVSFRFLPYESSDLSNETNEIQ